MGDIPASLKAKVTAYLNQAKERTAAGDRVIAYYCKVHALSEAMAVRANIPKGDMMYVMGLMDQVEAEKKGLDLEDAQPQIEACAQDLFDRADNADRANPTVPKLQTAKDFYAAATLLEVCKEFGELPEDLSEKIKYGKWRYIEICKAAKEKRAPVPPRGVDPGAGDEEGSTLAAAPPPPPAADAGASYLDLPPPAAPGQQYAPPAQHPPSASVPQSSFEIAAPTPPTAYPAQPPPAYPQAAGFVPPAVPAAPVYVPPPAGFKPDRAAIMEAARTAQAAVSSLQFQNVDTAVSQLQKALTMLTMPQAPTVDE